MIVFDRSFPQQERAWIGRLVRLCQRKWELQGWEIRLYVYRFRAARDCAEINTQVRGTAHIAHVRIAPWRLRDRRALRADLLHEFWHLHDDTLRQTIDDLVAHIDNPHRRRRARERAMRRYEEWHDRTARIVGNLL